MIMSYEGEGVQMKDVYTIRVICTNLLRRGEGEDKSDPIRRITQYWTMDGFLLAEVDPYKPDAQELK